MVLSDDLAAARTELLEAVDEYAQVLVRDGSGPAVMRANAEVRRMIDRLIQAVGIDLADLLIEAAREKKRRETMGARTGE